MKTKFFSQVVLLAALLGAVVLVSSPEPVAAGEAHVLALSVLGHGSIQSTPDQPSYASGQKVSLTAVPDPGWQFVEWRGEFDVPANWHEPQLRYRLALSVNSGIYPRFDQPAQVKIDFAAELAALGAAGEFDPKSLRVVETDADGGFVGEDVPFQFDTASSASGTLIFLLAGQTPANSTRYFYIYFETKDAGVEPVEVPAQVIVKDNVADEGQLSFQVDTANASYFLQKQGAALSSLVDSSARDWIGYHPTGGAAGNFRGIPNVQPDYFHPGATTGTSTLVSSGPMRAVIRTKTSNNWEMEWQFYPRFAQVTVLKMDAPYWFLYEGTPGGTLDLMSDFVVRSNGAKNMAYGFWTSDLPSPEWLYFSDPQLNRSLFMAHDADDAHIDSYWQMNSEMAVFGYGRDNLTRYLAEVPNTFILGLIDTTVFETAAERISGIYQPLQVTLIGSEQRSTQAVDTTNPLLLEVNHDMAITAFFAQVRYALGVSTVGQGSVTITPLKATYTYGEVVHLLATPAPGWTFVGWSGGITDTNPEIDVTIAGNTRVIATFSPPQETSLHIHIVGKGQVTRTPEGDLNFGDVVTLQAKAGRCWKFAGWSGSLSGSDNPATLLMNGNKEVTATFTEIGCRAYLPMLSS